MTQRIDSTQQPQCQPLVTVVIAHDAQDDALDATLQSLGGQAEDVEVLVARCAPDVQQPDVADADAADADAAVDQSAEALQNMRVLDGTFDNRELAWNAGLQQACGQYVLFAMPGTVFEQDAVRALGMLAQQWNLDELLFSAGNANGGGGLAHTNRYYGIYTGQAMLGKLMQCGDFPMSACLSLRRTSLLEQGQIAFCPDANESEALLGIQSLALAGSAYCVDGAFCTISACSSQPETTLQGIVSFLEQLAGFACAHGLATNSDFCSSMHEMVEHQLAAAERLLSRYDGWARRDVLLGLIGSQTQQTAMGTFLLSTALTTKMRATSERDARIASLEAQLAELEESTSLRVGRGITALPRFVKDARQAAEQGPDSPQPDAPATPSPTTQPGVNPVSRSPRLVVSLTSFPPRIDTVRHSLESLLSQSISPDKLLLWLASEQFPNREDDLPGELLDLRKRGLEIKWCSPDIKSHKRYYFAMREFPDDLMVEFDDDLTYPGDYLQLLYDSYQQHPHAVSAIRAHRITFNPDGSVAPYAQWVSECTEFVNQERMDLMATNGAGTLYPPHCLPDQTFDMDALMQLAPNADDIWLKVMQLIAGTPVVLPAPRKGIDIIPGTQDVATLWSLNRISGGNDAVLAALLQRYDANGELLRLMRDDQQD